MNKNLRIGITGGTGMVGTHLIAGLLTRGYTNIVALKRKTSTIRLDHPSSDVVQWKNGDILDIPSLERAFKDVEVVYHCAGLVSFQISDKRRLKKINIEGTRNMVNLSIDFGVSKFIYLSSVAAIGRPENENILIDEETKWEDSYRNSPYAISKRHAELEVWRGQSEGLSTLILNPSTILGSGFWESGSGALIPKFLKSYFYPEGSNGFVAIEDIVSILIKALTYNGEGERFILSAENLPYKALMEVANSTADQKMAPIRLRSSIIPILVPFLPLLKPFIGNGSIISKHSLVISSSHSKYNGEKAKETFQHEYKSVFEVVRRITRQYQSLKKDPES